MSGWDVFGWVVATLMLAAVGGALGVLVAYWYRYRVKPSGLSTPRRQGVSRAPGQGTGSGRAVD